MTMAMKTAVRRSSETSTWTTLQPWITTVVRAGLAVVLFLAGWAKFREPPALQRVAVSSYEILPSSMVGVVGVGLPVLELALAVMLLAGFATRFIAVAAGLLMIIFIAGIISAWARGLRIDCGCFGGGGATKDPKYLQEIFRDLGFLALAVWITVMPKSKLALDRLLGIYTD
jgi:uncharacterized membrane protein YphA (DoxX/SURF4 family)